MLSVTRNEGELEPRVYHNFEHFSRNNVFMIFIFYCAQRPDLMDAGMSFTSLLRTTFLCEA